jgi:excisionase family DNA binding protein
MAVRMEEEYWKLDEVAERLRVTRRTLDRWVANGALPVIRLSAAKGSVRVADSDLRKFLDERRTKPKDPNHTLEED